MTDAHTLWKTAHIISSTVVFGTGLGIAFFAWFGYLRAMKIGQIDGLRSTLWLTIIGDSCLTAPAIVFQLVSGLVLMDLASWSFSSPLVMVTLGLFFLVNLLWLPVFIVQILMGLEANRTASIADLSPRFHRRFLLWFVVGGPAFPVVLVIFYLMVAKPLPFS